MFIHEATLGAKATEYFLTLYDADIELAIKTTNDAVLNVVKFADILAESSDFGVHAHTVIFHNPKHHTIGDFILDHCVDVYTNDGDCDVFESIIESMGVVTKPNVDAAIELTEIRNNLICLLTDHLAESAVILHDRVVAAGQKGRTHMNFRLDDIQVDGDQVTCILSCNAE